MSLVIRTGEAVARAIDRRAFLSRATAALFAVVTGMAAGSVFAPLRAYASHCGTFGMDRPGTQCTPIGDRWCDPSNCNPFCNSANCVYYFGIYPDTACWCNQLFAQGCDLFYWQCCDCNCGGTTCTCGNLVYAGPNCVPGCPCRPRRPSSKAA